MTPSHSARRHPAVPSPPAASVAGALIGLCLVLAGATTGTAIAAGDERPADAAVPQLFVDLLLGASGERDAAELLAGIDASWQPGHVPMVLESLQFARDFSTRHALLEMLERHAGQSYGNDLDAWYRWLWSMPERRHPHYADFKSRLYRNIDPLFAGYFDDARATSIRLDEVRWGGVRQDGIPPLRQPAMIEAADADYLADADVVFALAIDGDARAYPKRILAWHEMFVDEIAGREIAGVYCTLCGAVIPYETQVGGTRHELGTSGFLYRSNKLMYDRATQSLWSTTLGEPVIGPLVGEGIALPRGHVVTTTWGEWRRRHPETTVLSLDTGHRRDYGEGVAYSDYFASDELMFTVPETDDRLANKDEILALQFPDVTDEVLAIGADYLREHPLYHGALGSQAFVVLTDGSGANRVYETKGVEFTGYDGDAEVLDADGGRWTLDEGALRKVGDEIVLARLPAHRAFWFGWYAVHDDTGLVH